jgi:hypothetical protein
MTESTVASVANKVTIGGGATAFFGGMTANEFAAYGGLLVGALGLVVQIVFKLRADRRHGEEHVARMAMFARGVDPDHGD